MNTEKILKYTIWTGLISIFFIPLIVSGRFYFPYIVSKTLVFKIAIEVLFLLFLGLAIIRKEYRPKLNLVTVLFFLYIAAVFLSSLVNDGFYFSFWSNNERSEGLILLLHLFLYLFVLTGFLRRTKEWLAIFEASFISSILVSLLALGQYFNLEWIIASAAGERLTSTIGNAGYVAGYLIFNIFFGFILFFFRKNTALRWYYALGILLQIFIALNTLTRGAILSLFFSLFIFIFYIAFFYLRDNKVVRNTGIAVLLLGVIFIVFVLVNMRLLPTEQASWIWNNNILRRTVNISLSDTTTENRLMIWNLSFQGFKEKPILGYGYDNFYEVFDKHFNSKIYRKAGSVVWFDRAHNIIFDRLITGGIIGLSLYLSLLFVPLIYLWAYFKRKKERYLIPVVLTLVIVSYFIQNLFIFEALVTYIPLFLILGYLSKFCPTWPGNFSQSKKTYLITFIIGVLVFLPVLFAFNIRPALANRALINAMIMTRLEKYKEAHALFVNILDRETYGNQEYRQHFAELITLANKNPDINDAWLNQGIIRAGQEFENQIKEKPLSARNYLMFMRFLNNNYGSNPNYLIRALMLSEEVAKISPNRPQIYHETSYSQFYLGRYYAETGEIEKAERLFDQAVASMQKGIDLNPSVVESYFNMIMILFVADKSDQVQSYLDKMDELSLNYHDENLLVRVVNSAIRAEEHEWARKIYQELTQIAPENPEHWINLALSYAHLGQRQKAIETAKKVAQFGGNYVEQSENFIQDVLVGKYK